MSSEKIQVVVTAQDRASPTLNKLKTNVQQLGSKTKGPLGGMLGGFGGISPLALGAAAGIGILTAKLGEGFKSMIDEEVQLGRLDQALENNVKGWDGNRDAIDKMVASSMDLAFADDETRESLIKLVPATKDATKAMELSHLAMDIARGRNIDLASATDIVVKANMGNVGALKRMGIELDKDATSTEILTELQKTYAGQAEKYAESTAGKVDAANVKVNEGFESLAGGITQAAAEIMKFGEQGPQAMDLIIDRLFGNGAHAQAIIQGRIDDYAAFVQGKINALSDVFKAPGAQAAKVYGTAFNDNIKKIRFGEFLTDDLAGALRAGVKDDIAGAMDAVTWAIKHPLALTRQTAAIEGALTTLEYKRGLASNTPEVNAVIDQQIAGLQKKWSELTGAAYQKGVSAANALERGLRTFTPVNVGNPYVGRGKVFTGGRAAGGDVSPGETVLVGERGPELMTAGRRGGHVTPNHALGAGGAIHVVTVNELARLLDQNNGRRLALSPSSAYSR